MKAKIIRWKNLEEKEYGNTKVTDILNEETWPYFSIAKVRKTGDDIRTGYDNTSNLAYYILEGEGKCIIDGEEHYVKQGDCILYPAKVSYKHLNGLTLLAIASPRFDRGDRTYTE